MSDLGNRRLSIGGYGKPKQLPQLEQSTLPKAIQRRDNNSMSRDNMEDVRIRTMKQKRPTCPVSMQLPEMDLPNSQCVTPEKKRVIIDDDEDEQLLDEDSDSDRSLDKDSASDSDDA